MTLPKYNIGDTVVVSDSQLFIKKWRGLAKVLEVQKDRREGGTFQYLIEDIPPEDVIIHMRGIVDEQDIGSKV